MSTFVKDESHDEITLHGFIKLCKFRTTEADMSGMTDATVLAKGGAGDLINVKECFGREELGGFKVGKIRCADHLLDLMTAVDTFIREHTGGG